MEHFIITNRDIKVEDGVETVNEDGTEPANHSMRFGTYDGKKITLFEDTPPDMADIPYSDPDRRKVGSGQFFESLYEAMCSDSRDVLLFIHGFANKLSKSLDFLEELEKKYTRRSGPIGRIILFTWPSNGSKLQYRRDAPDAVDSGHDLGRMYLKLSQFVSQRFALKPDGSTDPKSCGQKIHLMAQSMGNLVLQSMVEMILTSNVPFASLFGEVIMTGADIAHTALEAPRPLSRITSICDRAHVYMNKKDRALGISQTTKNPHPRLGKTGPRNVGAIPNDTHVVDISETSGEKNLSELITEHRYFIFVPRVVSDMRLVLFSRHTEEIGRKWIGHKRTWRVFDDDKIPAEGE